MTKEEFKKNILDKFPLEKKLKVIEAVNRIQRRKYVDKMKSNSKK